MVYAPQTGVSISGTAPVFGDVVVITITVGNSGTIHYDTSLNAIWPDIWNLIFSPHRRKISHQRYPLNGDAGEGVSAYRLWAVMK